MLNYYHPTTNTKQNTHYKMPQQTGYAKATQKSRDSDGNFWMQAQLFNRNKPSIFNPKDTTERTITASVKLDGTQTNIVVDHAGVTQIITHNGGIVFDSLTNKYHDFQGKLFKQHSLASFPKFVATFADMVAQHPTLTKIIISAEYMFPKCGALVRREGLNATPYPESMIGLFMAFEIQLFFPDNTRQSLRLDGSESKGAFSSLDTPDIVFHGTFNMHSMVAINDWMIANADTHEGVVVTITNVPATVDSDDDESAGAKPIREQSYKYRTAVTDSSSGPDSTRALFIPGTSPYITDMLRMMDETSKIIKPKSERIKSAPNVQKQKPKFDIRQINIVITKELEHGEYRIKFSDGIDIQQQLRDALFSELKRNNLYIDETTGQPINAARGYIMGITKNVEKFLSQF